MADCEVCGRPATTTAVIEGATLQVCQGCVRYGKEVSAFSSRFLKPVKLAPEVELVEGYGMRISTARAAKRLTREELAKHLNIKEKDLQHFEEEKVKPTEAEAEKLSKYLGITLIIKVEPLRLSTAPKRSSSAMPTLGDFVKVNKK